MIRKIRLFLRDNAIMRKLLYPFVRWLMVDVIKYRLLAMRRYGYEAVAKIQKVSDELGISCYPMFGTLLGFVRDGGFIAHDSDMDFMISDEAKIGELYRFLLKEGFSFNRYILFDGKFKEFSMKYKECSIDFFGRGDDLGNGMYKLYTENYGEFWGSLEFPSPRNPQPYEVHGVKTILPENYEEILVLNYGNYREKVLKWDAKMAPAFRTNKDNHTVMKSCDESSWLAWLRNR